MNSTYIMSVRIIFVRHGETADNVGKVNGGSLPTPLTEKGRLQARKAGVWLRETMDERIDIAFVSDIRRARETAEEILKMYPLVQVKHDARIRETSFGILEGSPAGTKRKEADRLGIPFVEFRPQGGESLIDLRKRVHAFLDEVTCSYQGKTVLVVSHGGPITNMLMEILEFQDIWQEYDKHHPHNTAITILEIDKDKTHRLHVLNSLEHLA